MSWLTTSPELPRWSDWNERELGFSDNPTHIQCRNCGAVLPAKPLFFRRVVNEPRFSLTCRTCTSSAKHLRTVNAKTRAIMRDPTMSPAAKAAAIAALPAEKNASLRAARAKQLDTRFRVEWTVVRKAIVQRKGMLVANIDASKYRKTKHNTITGLHAAMEMSPAVANYIEELRAMYSNIIHRLLRLDDWHDTIGDHYPPPYWSLAIKAMLACKAKTFWREDVLTINPWVLTTREERARIKAADPKGWDPGDPFFRDLLLARHQSRRLLVHLYPWQYPVDDKDYVQQTPDWLRPFNGTGK